MLRKKGPSEDSSVLIEEHRDKSNGYGSLEADSNADQFELNTSSKGDLSSEVYLNFFRDGRTQIDFVLVWETSLNDEEEQQQQQRDEIKGSESGDHLELKTEELHKSYRKRFLESLVSAGIKLEEHTTQDETTKVHYVLLHAPWNVLCYYAEELSLRVPLQAIPNQSSNWSAKVLKKLRISNVMYEELPGTPMSHYTCQFKVTKLSRFLGSDNHDTFFTNTQRHQILYEILARTPYGQQKRGEVGVDRLLNEKIFKAAFPLHDGPYEMPSKVFAAHILSLRQILFRYWARWGKWNKYQPLDHIRKYFGEKIALYFAWLGFYTGWLLPASVMGTLVFLLGIFLMLTDTPAMEICSMEEEYLMCPVCKVCPYWNISSICTTYKAGLLFDHGGTIFYSIFISLWAVTFLEYWKRTNATLAHHWDCFDFQEIEERPRPEFTAMAPLSMRNPITGTEEPYFPEWNRTKRILTGSMAIVVMITVVLMFLISVILYRAIVSILVAKSGNGILQASALNIASITGSMVNLIFILILSRIYISLAHFLTRWEMHRTQTMYDDAFTFKVFIFQFVNFYSSPIYIAFFKGRFVGYPSHYNTLFSVRNEDCKAGGCLIELAQEMLVIMVGKQVINNIQEFVIPKLKNWWQKHKLHRKEKGKEKVAALDPWERDYQLLAYEGLFDEYLEMVIQFGFITIFVAACPLAPLFALLNNWVEIRLDAHKFVCEYRRPVVERAQGIGIWFYILEVITYLAVISNAFLIAFTSDFLPRLYYKYTHNFNLMGYVNFTLAYAPQTFVAQNNTLCRYRAYRKNDGTFSLVYWNLLAIRLGFVIVFEHVVFFISRMIDMLVPDIPASVEIKVKREHYMAKQALADNQSLGQILFRPEDSEMAPKEREDGTAQDPLTILPAIPEQQPF
ncbi:anoctamin-7 [Rhinatrema bivittatum]|uniref:anoctamin-7 n=1 Tax=Rhinatrema bivittatum TaxID=194408 RepID=UPI00112E8CB3|nr:anoctamin-7 [Rhinatrema bivittatum]XP_029472984.1 anoctamin-7 [Rhinatrema bivittatum]XP_029472985.1 anoctamin-7 [Rhinatrema bivittatum]XP_029472986.1 anoctamin-7 [Rhinatrema bivittatum]